MTTVTANHECMAADEMICGDGPICHTSKLRRVGNSVFGYAGDAFMALTWFEWFTSPRRSPQTLHKLLGDEDRAAVAILELNPSGLVLWNGWGVPMPIRDRFYSIGAGAGMAIQAMEMGASPVDAVRAAAKYDENTRGIEEMWLLPPELLPKRKRRGK